MLFAMTEVVREMIPFGLERVVVLVLDFPPAAPGRDERDDVRRINALRTGPGVAIENRAVGVRGGEFAPAHEHGVVAITQRQVIEPTIGIGETPGACSAVLDDRRHVTGALEVRHPLVEQGMRRRQAHEQKRAPVRQHLLAERLMAVEIIAQQGGAPRGDAGTPVL